MQLLMGNHESHMNIKTISLPKEQNFVILTFRLPPLHPSNPTLDATLYFPFKNKYCTAQNSLLTIHPEKNIFIYNAASLSRIVYCSALKKNIIMHGFQHIGTPFFYAQTLRKEDFLVSPVTDRPLINEKTPKEVFSFPSTSCSSYNAT